MEAQQNSGSLAEKHNANVDASLQVKAVFFFIYEIRPKRDSPVSHCQV